METRSPRQAMLDLLDSQDKRTKIGRFREIHDLVEQAIHAGARRQTIISALKDAGLDLSPATLNSYLTRLRKKSPPQPGPPPRAAQPLPPAPNASPSAIAPTPPAATPTPTRPDVPGAPPLVDFAEIRNRTHDLDKLSRQWRAKRRAEAQAAKPARTAGEAPKDSSDSG